MGNFAKIDQNWRPVCADTSFEIPTNHPVVCMEHKKTKEHAYFDLKLNRFLSQQEAFDVLSGKFG